MVVEINLVEHTQRPQIASSLTEHPLETRVTVRLIVLLFEGTLVQLLQTVRANKVLRMEFSGFVQATKEKKEKII